MSSAAVLFFLTIAVMGPLMRLGSSTMTALARSETRPAPPIALGLIVCGTLCVISSLWFAWSAHASSGPQGLANAMQQMRSQLPNGASIQFDIPNFARGTSTAGGPMILTAMPSSSAAR